LRRFLLMALLYVFVGNSLFPNYNMEHLSSPPQDEVYELSSGSFDDSTIIGEYPTKSKKLKKGIKAVYVDNAVQVHGNVEKKVYPPGNHVSTHVIFLTPYQYQSNYL
jgi:hypothetical protein